MIGKTLSHYKIIEKNGLTGALILDTTASSGGLPDHSHGLTDPTWPQDTGGVS